jgi:FKBP-type peptidyl-prolyl cis-trans isomerase FklB
LTTLLFTAGAFAADPVELKDDTAKISYSLGYQIGGDFKRQRVGIDSAAIVQGIQDALDAKDPALSQQEMNDLLVSLKQKVVAVQQRESIRSSKEFLAENMKKEGVKELPGGSQYRVIQGGSGASPTLEDTVDIHFRTLRPDGTTIATTRSEKAPRAYQVKKMLPGLQQALLKMSPGATWEVFVPPSDRNEMMESGGILIYEIELISIHPAAGSKS